MQRWGIDGRNRRRAITWICLELKAGFFTMPEDSYYIEAVGLSNVKYVCHVVASQISARRDAARHCRRLPVECDPAGRRTIFLNSGMERLSPL